MCMALVVMTGCIVNISSFAQSNLWHIVEQKKSVTKNDEVVDLRNPYVAIDVNNQEALEKYNFYVKSYNFIEDKFALILWSYDRTFTDDLGQFIPPSKELMGDINFFNFIDIFVEEMVKVETYANKAPFNEEADVCAINMSRDAVSVMETINELHDYYKSGECLNDNLLKGQRLHTQLREELEALDISKEAFKEAFGMVITYTEVSERLRLADEGYLIHYNAIEALVIAKQLVNDWEDISIDDELVRLNTIYNGEYERFVEFYDVFVNESSKSNQLTFEGFDSTNGVGRFGEDFLNLNLAMKQLYEAINANTLIDEGWEYVELSDEVYLAYKDFSDEFKSCVSAYNIHFRGRKSDLMIDNHGYFVKLYEW